MSEDRYVDFATWSAVLSHVQQGIALYYKAPLDHTPIKVRARVQADDRTLQIIPVASQCDRFVADSKHLDRCFARLGDYAEWSHKYEATRRVPTLAPHAFIKVTAGLHYMHGNQRPYFSVTGEVWASPNARDCETCGCIHDEILKYFPRLAPVIALHLSDDTGAPSHTNANAWYWLAGYYEASGSHTGERYHGSNRQYVDNSADTSLRIFADHIRVPIDNARGMAEEWRSTVADDPQSVRRWLYAFLDSHATRARWQAEATAACALLDELIAAKGQPKGQRS